MCCYYGQWRGVRSTLASSDSQLPWIDYTCNYMISRIPGRPIWGQLSTDSASSRCSHGGVCADWKSHVQIFAKPGTRADGVFDPPCNWIWGLLRCRAQQIYRWSWGQSLPYQCAVDLAQYQRHCYRCDEHACEYVNQVHIKYICYGCCAWSCCRNRSIVWIICCFICSISAYTMSLWSEFTYSNWCSNSHMFMYSICNCSRNSKTANVFSWKATAQVSMTAYSRIVRQSILLFNEYIRIHFWAFDITHLHKIIALF